jgi:hypothetical protein
METMKQEFTEDHLVLSVGKRATHFDDGTEAMNTASWFFSKGCYIQ